MEKKKIVIIICIILAAIFGFCIVLHFNTSTSSTRELSLILSSIKEDMKIKLVDSEDHLVKGVMWGVTVTNEESGDAKNYEDEDKDGIIHISNVKPGDYSVAHQSSEDLNGYTFSTNGQKVTVKDKAEYKVIDRIMEEIKQESEVDAEAEDSNGNDAPDVESSAANSDTGATGEESEADQTPAVEHANETGVLGIDVSKFQPTINWDSVKSSGVEYVIIRCGYRGAKSGALVQDSTFTSHISGAQKAGLKVGIYFFSTALNESEAIEEASMCASLCSKYEIDYPVFIDVEESDRDGYNDLSAEDRTNNIKAFCRTISSAGYTPGLYSGEKWLSGKIDTAELSCKIWLAQYNDDGPTYTGHYDIWQYTSNGKVDGINVDVDMNHSYMED